MTEAAHQDLLIELGCEELPPKALPELAQAFFDGVCAGLTEAGIEFSVDDSACYFTPRRMAMCLGAVADRQPDRQQDRRGPAVSAAFDESGAPTQAASGFARSVGKQVDALETLKTDKGEWLFCRIDIEGKSLADLIFPMLQAALDQLPVPKPMRWSDHDFSFVRPVHWLVVLHGGTVLDGSLFDCAAGRLTRGHRIHAPGPHEISTANDYLDVLHEARVEVDQRSRRQKIHAQAIEAGRQMGGEARITDALLDEVCNLVEWPAAVACRFEQEFLEVPQEALVASMENHQKFFPVVDADTGGLMPAFVAIANIESRDVTAVREGFERVIRPRLADARFFWDQDLKSSLEQCIPALNKVVFQKDLGTIGDKSHRIESLSKKIEGLLDEDSSGAERAALLSKCDLVSHMVGEFPELQGVMGGYYAEAAGEAPEVAIAIGSHYRPRFSGDDIPTDIAGRIVSLADRMDTLVGIFAAGLKPSGNKDPFALRRAALGVIRILVEGGLPLAPAKLIELAAEGLADQVTITEETRDDVYRFLLDRLHQFLRSDRGASAKQVLSILAAPLTTLPDLEARLAAVQSFMQRPEADSLVAANKRIGNILKKSAAELSEQIEASLLEFDEERQLFEEIISLEDELFPLFESGGYDQALGRLAALRETVDAFFDHVMVMDENPDVQRNRLALLSRLKSLFDRIADLSLAA